MGAVASKINSVIVRNLIDYWIDNGVDSKEIWPVLGIEPDSPLPLWVDTSRMAAIYEKSIEYIDDPVYPFSLGFYISKSDIPLQRIVRYAPTLKSGISLLNSYSYLYSQSFYYVVTETDSDEVRISVKKMENRVVSLYQLCLGLMYITCICQEVLGDKASHYLKIEAPEELMNTVDNEAVREYMNLDVFTGDGFLLKISSDAWEAPILTYNPELFDTAHKELKKQDNRYQQNISLYSELQKVIESCLLKKNISQEIVSGELGISVRNLQRRLYSLGTSYQQLLDDSRQELTMKLLQEGNNPVYEIAFMVGYTEPSAFYKAFRRWTGMTPGNYVKKLKSKSCNPF